MMTNKQKPLTPWAFGADKQVPSRAARYGILSATILGLAGCLPMVLVAPAHASPGQEMLNLKARVGSFMRKEKSAPNVPFFLLAQATGDLFLIGNITGAPGEPLGLNLKLPADAAETFSFLMVRGLPEGFRLSAGFKTKNYWAVSVNDANSVQLLPPAGYAGSFQLEVLIIKKLGTEPARGIASVEIGAQRAVPTTATAPTTLPAEQPQIVPETNPAAKADARGGRGITAEETAMLERGNRLLQNGDVASARLLYERVARLGLAEGAIAMAGTYDPIILQTVPVAGMRPDIEQAIKWYKTAEALGSSAARSRLLALESPVARR